MSAEAVLTLAVLGLSVVAIIREWASPAAALLGALVILVLARVVEPLEGFSGFSSSATITIAGLFVVAGAVRQHGRLEPILARLLGRTERERATLARLLVPTAVLSAVLANTPTVASLAPMVRAWAEKHGQPASHFLLPVSYAAMLGGMLTVIGTSTTLLVSGLLVAAGEEPLAFFEILPLGLPVAALGLGLIVLLAPALLPDRRSSHELVATHDRDYSFRLQIEPGGPLDGMTVALAGLRNLEGVFLARIDRSHREIAPVAPTTGLEGADVLTFVGGVDHVRDLTGRDGLVPAEQQASLVEGPSNFLTECVVASGSHLVGQTLKQASFRGRYGGAVVAIHRAGQRVEGKLGSIPLHAGDALLVLADAAFADRWRNGSDFAVVVPLDGAAAGETRSRLIVVGSLLGLVVLAATGLLSVLEATLLACAVLVATRALTFHEARQAVDVDVILVVASAIGLGAAVRASGLAGSVATAVVDLAGTGSAVLALAALVAATLLLTELVTNVAAAAMLVPVALDVAGPVGAEPRGFVIAVAVAASASFLTPIGYQTNTIVYGLGGYRFSDYWRLGLPISLSVIATALVVVPVVWG